jgi:hypothetical protein
VRATLGRRARGRRGLELESGSGTVGRKGIAGGSHLSVAAGAGGRSGGLAALLGRLGRNAMLGCHGGPGRENKGRL